MYSSLSRIFVGRYLLLLMLILADYIALSVVGDYPAGRILTELLLGGTLLLTILITRARRIWFNLALLGSAVTVLAALVGFAFVQSARTTGVLNALGVCLILLATFAILRDVANHKVVTAETVLAATCIYLLVGVGFALLFASIGAFTTGGFFIGQSTANVSDYLFFSFTTITTVGYGNLVPAAPLGQSLAMVEALSGQIYLVLVVARLVSLWGQELPPRHRRERTDHEESPPTN
ncbi:MAG TPA: ion channel [Ktedonobacterales bacterium]|nr:ion channel [Ktedonobacterales bacterium]